MQIANIWTQIADLVATYVQVLDGRAEPEREWKISDVAFAQVEMFELPKRSQLKRYARDVLLVFDSQRIATNVQMFEVDEFGYLDWQAPDVVIGEDEGLESDLCQSRKESSGQAYEIDWSREMTSGHLLWRMRIGKLTKL